MGAAAAGKVREVKAPKLEVQASSLSRQIASWWQVFKPQAYLPKRYGWTPSTRP